MSTQKFSHKYIIRVLKTGLFCHFDYQTVFIIEKNHKNFCFATETK